MMPDSIIRVACGACRALAVAPAVVGRPTPRTTFSPSWISRAAVMISSSSSVYFLAIEQPPFFQNLFHFFQSDTHGAFPLIVIPAGRKSATIICRRREVGFCPDGIEFSRPIGGNVVIDISLTVRATVNPFVHPGFKAITCHIHQEEHRI